MPHQRQVTAYLVGRLRDFHVAEDIWQETTVAAWKSYGSHNQAVPYAAWVFGIARNLMLKHLRDKPKETSLPDEILENVAGSINEDDDTLVRERNALRNCVEALPSYQRDMLRMRYEQDTSLKDLAAMIGKTIGAVNMLLNRIRTALLECSRATLGKQSES